MPSFTSAGAELRQLARTWRTGNRAFRELFNVLPKEPGDVYNKIVIKPSAPSSYREALLGVNDAWITSQVSKAAKPHVQAIRRQKQQLAERDLTKREITQQLKPLRQSLQQKREQLTQELKQQGGMLSQIKGATSSSVAANTKALLVLSLGQYLEENP